MSRISRFPLPLRFQSSQNPHFGSFCSSAPGSAIKLGNEKRLSALSLKILGPFADFDFHSNSWPVSAHFGCCRNPLLKAKPQIRLKKLEGRTESIPTPFSLPSTLQRIWATSVAQGRGQRGSTGRHMSVLRPGPRHQRPQPAPPTTLNINTLGDKLADRGFGD